MHSVNFSYIITMQHWSTFMTIITIIIITIIIDKYLLSSILL